MGQAGQVSVGGCPAPREEGDPDAVVRRALA